MGIDCKSRELEHVSREIFHFTLATRNTGEKNGWILADSYANSDTSIPDECEKTSAVI